MDLITCYQLTIFLLSMQHIFKVNADLPLSADNQKSQLLVSDNEFDHLASPVISTLTVDTATQLSTQAMHKVEQGSVPAGIYLRISQKGVDYIMDLAAQALPQLLEKSEMPTIEQPQIKISHLTIDKFSQPTLKAKFIPNTG
ncbi:unnamed protein product [Thelazia callipaeda]|uniref:Lipoprotein n=1 Tax=Thelazia callipaeda TaxID=103827 RepID=A0A0N5CTM4_THECL|nr:unnamed protein product [Thelazia callipaeda]